jgi:NAD(P)-dependent dehydrogenase (short-subunit alcohol dehydrogenase family)
LATENPQPSILITGAGSGIGRATAELFAREGWFVGALDVNAAALDALKLQLGDAGHFYCAVDVSQRPALLEAIALFSAATGGRLDVLFNNAGIDAKGRFDAMDWARIVNIVNVNLLAGMSLIHAALPMLKSTPGSLCLSTSSASAIFGTAEMAVYSATKHALKGLTEALSVEFAALGVRAADILPGIIDTGMHNAEHKQRLPTQGMWRVLSAQAIAAVVWDAYRGDKLHWYAPAELAEFDVEVTRQPEATRDKRIAGRLS